SPRWSGFRGPRSSSPNFARPRTEPAPTRTRTERWRDGTQPMNEQGADLLTEPLLRSIGLDQLVPAALDRWRPLIIDGVLFLLRRLARPRQAAILQAQLQLPAGVTPAQRAVALLQQCPTLHKLGQVVARHRGIPAHVRRELHVLESPPSTTPTAELIALVRRELPPDAPVTIADQALAEGSVAVVIPF